jgi:hypothetical protein
VLVVVEVTLKLLLVVWVLCEPLEELPRDPLDPRDPACTEAVTARATTATAALIKNRRMGTSFRALHVMVALAPGHQP